MQDEDSRPISAVVQTDGSVLSDHKIRSSEDIVQLPQSRVILSTTEPQPVKSSEATREKNIAALDAVKSSSRPKQIKRQSSSVGLHEPRSKRSRYDQKRKRESTSAVWTDLLISDTSKVGRDACEDVSTVNMEKLKGLASSVAASSVVTCEPLVSEAGQTQIATLKKSAQQNSADSTKLPLKVINAVDSDSADTSLSSQTAASVLTLSGGDGIGRGTVTVDATDRCQSINTTSSSVAAHLLKSPPAVQRTLLTDFHSSTQESLPSAPVQIIRTSSPVSSSLRSGSSAATKTVFLVPVHTNSGNITPASVFQVRPSSDICKMLAATDNQNVSIRPASSTATQQYHSGGASLSVVPRVTPQSKSSAQSKPSVDSDLLSTSTLSVPVRPSVSGVAVRLSVTVSSPQQCSASVGTVQRQTLSPLAGHSGSQCSSTTNQIRPRAVSAQPIRIRINATDLGNTADPSAVMHRVHGILSKTNTILPGAQIRIRYLPPPTTSSQTPGVQSCPTPQTTTADQVKTRVSQLDGTVDSDSESEMAASELSENTSPSCTGVDNENVHTVRSIRRSKAADADEKPASDFSVR